MSYQVVLFPGHRYLYLLLGLLPFPTSNRWAIFQGGGGKVSYMFCSYSDSQRLILWGCTKSLPIVRRSDPFQIPGLEGRDAPECNTPLAVLLDGLPWKGLPGQKPHQSPT